MPCMVGSSIKTLTRIILYDVLNVFVQIDQNQTVDKLKKTRRYFSAQKQKKKKKANLTDGLCLLITISRMFDRSFE